MFQQPNGITCESPPTPWNNYGKILSMHNNQHVGKILSMYNMLGRFCPRTTTNMLGRFYPRTTCWEAFVDAQQPTTAA